MVESLRIWLDNVIMSQGIAELENPEYSDQQPC